jgi:hypothetical protein
MGGWFGAVTQVTLKASIIGRSWIKFRNSAWPPDGARNNIF